MTAQREVDEISRGFSSYFELLRVDPDDPLSLKRAWSRLSATEWTVPKEITGILD